MLVPHEQKTAQGMYIFLFASSFEDHANLAVWYFHHFCGNYVFFSPGLRVGPENAPEGDRGGVPLLRLIGHPLDPRYPTPCAVPLRDQQSQEL